MASNRFIASVMSTAIAAMVSGFCAGCLPSRVLIDLDPNLRDLRATTVIDERGDRGARVALIDLTGPLDLTGSGGPLALGGGRTNVVDRFVARLEKAERDDDVKAVLVRINSPGGTVAASETLYEEVVRFRQRTSKPVVVSLGEIATSGGYYVALAGDAVYAQEATVTGSIGVIVQTFNASEGLGRIGVVGPAVTSRDNKDIANPFEPIEPAHYAILQNVVDEFYDAFREKVRERRPGIAAARFDELTDGRVLPGAQAAAAGLVDGVAGVRDAFAEAKRLAGVERADLVAYSPEGLEPASLYAVGSGAEIVGDASNGGGASRLRVSVLDAAGVLPRLRPGLPYYMWTAAAGGTSE